MAFATPRKREGKETPERPHPSQSARGKSVQSSPRTVLRSPSPTPFSRSSTKSPLKRISSPLSARISYSNRNISPVSSTRSRCSPSKATKENISFQTSSSNRSPSNSKSKVKDADVWTAARNEILKLEETLKQKIVELEKKDEEILISQQTVNAMQQMTETLANEVENLRENLTTLKNENEGMKLSGEKMNMENKNLKKNIQQSAQEKEKYEQVVYNFNEEKKHYEEFIHSLMAENETLKKDLSESAGSSQRIQVSRSDMEENLKKLETENRNLMKENEFLFKENENLNMVLTNKEKECEEERKGLKREENDKLYFEKCLRQEEKRNYDLMDAKEQLILKLNELSSEREEIVIKLQEERKQRKEKEERIRQREKDMEKMDRELKQKEREMEIREKAWKERNARYNFLTQSGNYDANCKIIESDEIPIHDPERDESLSVNDDEDNNQMIELYDIHSPVKDNYPHQYETEEEDEGEKGNGGKYFKRKQFHHDDFIPSREENEIRKRELMILQGRETKGGKTEEDFHLQKLQSPISRIRDRRSRKEIEGYKEYEYEGMRALIEEMMDERERIKMLLMEVINERDALRDNRGICVVGRREIVESSGENSRSIKLDFCVIEKFLSDESSPNFTPNVQQWNAVKNAFINMESYINELKQENRKLKKLLSGEGKSAEILMSASEKIRQQADWLSDLAKKQMKSRNRTEDELVHDPSQSMAMSPSKRGIK